MCNVVKPINIHGSSKGITEFTVSEEVKGVKNKNKIEQLVRRDMRAKGTGRIKQDIKQEESIYGFHKPKSNSHV